jgi:hypothetical protein
MKRQTGRIPSKRAFYDFETSGWEPNPITGFVPVEPVAIGVMYGPRGNRVAMHYINKTNHHEVTERAFRFFEGIAKAEGIFTFVAHNGGRFDALFMMHYAAKKQWRFTAIPIGSTILALEVHMPGLRQPLCFLDSMRIVPSSLKKAAEAFELPSAKVLTEDDYKIDARKWTMEKLESGVLADCEVGLDLLDKVESLFESQGGQLRLTFSSSALSVVKAQVKVPDMRMFKHLNKRASQAYCGGRTEILCHLPDTSLKMYDINSAYPWAMSQKLPWGDLSISRRPGADYAKGKAGVYQATVVVPDMYLPVLPLCHPTDGLFFPVGRFTGWWTEPELREATNLGTRIIKFHEGVLSAQYTHPFGDFIDKFYKMKTASKGAMRNFVKLILNGAYGKFAEKPEKSEIVGFNDIGDALLASLADKFFEDDDGPSGEYFTPFSPLSDPRLLIKHTYNWPKQTNYVLASYITALPRIRIARMLRNAVAPTYCDTDSVHCSDFPTHENLPIHDSDLGALKLEHRDVRAIYYAPKVYSFTLDGVNFVKSKGFGVGEKHKDDKGTHREGLMRIDSETLEALSGGDLLRLKRMELGKTLLKQRTPVVRRIEVYKRWRGFSVKRAITDAKGNTRPWSFKELEAKAHFEQESPARHTDWKEDPRGTFAHEYREHLKRSAHE